LLAALSDADPFIRSAAISSLAAPQFHGELEKALTNQSAAMRLGTLLALRRAGEADASAHVNRVLTDPDLQVRLMAVIWAGERQLTNVAASLPQALTSGQTSLTLLQAHAATAQILALASKAPPPASSTNSEVQFFSLNKKTSVAPFIETLRTATQRTPRQTQVEAIRHLAQASDPQAVALLEQIASDRRRATEPRAEAIVALAGVTRSAVLLPLLDDPASAIRIEAARALRLHRADAEVALRVRTKLAQLSGEEVALERQLRFLLPQTNAPATVTEAEWRTRLAVPGDSASGRRVFFNPAVGCATCHQIDGHGGYPGPDLSVITRGGSVDKLMISILDPSRDIPPQFVTHTVTTTDGESYSGLLIGQSSTAGVTLLGGDGNAIAIPPARITAQTQSDVSLMPEGLAQGLTTQDFRDLIAYLLTRK
jgi:putative heme-binding domain-containing protein